MRPINFGSKSQLLGQAQGRGALLFNASKAFRLKSGRDSPYFFNAAQLQDGESLHILSAAYAVAVHTQYDKEDFLFDVLYGPAYKGIPLATIASIGLYLATGVAYPVVFNRKEAKDHGEGGMLVGVDMKGKRVLIVDDVITAGTAAEESVRLITEAGGIPAGLVLILDRQERGKDSLKSAVQEVREKYGFPVFSILTFSDLLTFLHTQVAVIEPAVIAAMERYYIEYGVVD